MVKFKIDKEVDTVKVTSKASELITCVKYVTKVLSKHGLGLGRYVIYTQEYKVDNANLDLANDPISIKVRLMGCTERECEKINDDLILMPNIYFFAEAVLDEYWHDSLVPNYTIMG